MSKRKVTVEDLNDALFSQIQKLANLDIDNISKEELDKHLDISDKMTSLAKPIVEGAKAQVAFTKAAQNWEGRMIPTIFRESDKQSLLE